ncbi:MAG: hypothetical protein LBU46_03070, partial [Candidatus Accumulibacter sp.]|nr:hypothetical protein [Accumulibacter sp.]
QAGRSDRAASGEEEQGAAAAQRDQDEKDILLNEFQATLQKQGTSQSDNELDNKPGNGPTCAMPAAWMKRHGKPGALSFL